MTIQSGQKVYRVRGPDDRWVKKTGYPFGFVWVEHEHQATFWRKLHHLKAALKEGVFSKKDNLEGLPLAALKVYEYEVTIARTGRKSRLTELDKFHVKESEDGTKDV